MNVVIITGSGGLIGGEAVEFFSQHFDQVVGIDNDMRAYFFGAEASTKWNRDRLGERIPNLKQYDIDIRDYAALEAVFADYGGDVKLVIHTAAQPSHDWAAKEPLTDFGVNATGTMNMLELTRIYCKDAVFINTSTNKVYGDTPNSLPLVELDSRWEVDPSHPYAEHGIDEWMSIDQSTHSLFGASKVAADVMTQEYGRYFDMKTGVFRGGCLTGPNHSGTQLHGFLAYLMKCAITGSPYTIFGYKGKQVRDNIHSADLINMFWEFYQKPRAGEVYNVGGGRFANCSMIEAISLCEHISGKKMNVSYSETNRVGDHIWYVSNVGKFISHYPNWYWTYDLESTLTEIFNGLSVREK